MSQENPREQALSAFVGHLLTLYHRAEKGDSEARASLARLRRGAGREPGASPETLAEILPHLRADASPQDYAGERRVYFLIGSLFALHPAHSSDYRNLGTTLRELGDNPSAVQRFMRLLVARWEQLPDLLRQVVSLAAGHNPPVPINYFQLGRDLLDWDHPQRRVQLDWAREYWPPQSRSASAPQAATAAS